MPHAAPQPKPMQTVKGIPVSPGIVFGRVFVLGEAETHVPHHGIDSADVDAELARLDVALRELVRQPFGPYLLTAVAVGLAAFGLFAFAWARHLDR